MHTSPTVQALPSEHAAVLFTCTQPLTGLQLSLVHALPSSQFNAAPATQFVPVHKSGLVHTVLSALHALPVFCATNAHVPVVPSQVFLRQNVSFAALQVTTVAGLTRHLYGTLDLSQ